MAEPDSREPVERGAAWRDLGAAAALGVVARVRELLVALEAGLRGVGLRVAMAQN
jgi:hypothetical protein